VTVRSSKETRTKQIPVCDCPSLGIVQKLSSESPHWALSALVCPGTHLSMAKSICSVTAGMHGRRAPMLSALLFPAKTAFLGLSMLSPCHQPHSRQTQDVHFLFAVLHDDPPSPVRDHDGPLQPHRPGRPLHFLRGRDCVPVGSGGRHPAPPRPRRCAPPPACRPPWGRGGAGRGLYGKVSGRRSWWGCLPPRIFSK